MNTLKSIQTEIQKNKLPPLLARKFVGTKEDAKGKTVRILQWNVLAQALSQGADNFILCPAEALKWENRSLRIVEELLRNDASILCLQEVDFFSTLKDHLGKAHFSGVFHPKPESPCLDQEINTGPDGCAIFYDERKLKMLNSQNINLKFKEESTNQVAILCKFEGINEKKDVGTFCVAVTHLKASPGFEEYRQTQMKYLLQILQKEVGQQPLILAGDLNAQHTEPVYEEVVKSSFGLSSAYTFLSPKRVEPPFTTWQIRGGRRGNKEKNETIDYVFFSKNHFQVRSILDIPGQDEIGEKRLPSLIYPSDHLSLVCDLELTKSK
ncbi:hypothetical protein FSP39_008142 [Pinctada imbricata]|uniref:Nocturnin n=1 Tax=Pinctada imbricata TaxID=66713 RepID=A0AA88Y860_PINIB|nr:hypothetical protein FSP39_008142 [Pinctada imbricata]